MSARITEQIAPATAGERLQFRLRSSRPVAARRAMSNPYYDPELLETWRQRIARLRVLSDLPAPWDVDPDVERWKRGLGHGPDEEDFLNSHMLDWQVWLRSLGVSQRAEYQSRHPEPPGWGLYRLVFSRPTSSEVLEDKGPDVYWDSLEKHYEKVFGVA